jgi:hypothetical protein
VVNMSKSADPKLLAAMEEQFWSAGPETLQLHRGAVPVS